MSKARRTPEQKFHDEFADMSIADQAAALKMLLYEHDQAKRRLERDKASKGVVQETLAASREKLDEFDQAMKSADTLLEEMKETPVADRQFREVDEEEPTGETTREAT